MESPEAVVRMAAPAGESCCCVGVARLCLDRVCLRRFCVVSAMGWRTSAAGLLACTRSTDRSPLVVDAAVVAAATESIVLAVGMMFEAERGSAGLALL